MKQKKWMKALGAFLFFMAVMTAVSRSAASLSTAKVILKSPQNQLIIHRVVGSGSAKGTTELAVFAQEDLLVEQVLSGQGQAVEKGEALLVLSQDSIKKAIKDQEDKILELEEKRDDQKSQDAMEQAKRDREKAYASRSLAQSAVGAQIQVDNARTEADVAGQRLDDFYQDKQFSDGSLEDEETEKMLQDDLRLKQEALNQAIASYNQTVLSAKKAVEDAAAPLPGDSAQKALDRELNEAMAKRSLLEELLDKKGVVEAPEAGVVKSICVTTGSRTSQEAAAVLYKAGQPLRIQIPLKKEELSYVALGDRVKVTNQRGQELEGAFAEALAEDETDPDIWNLTIFIPPDLAVMGQSLTATIQKEEGPYDTCVPLSALHKANNETFVYVAEPKDAVLGQVLTARRVTVEVENKNEAVAALKSGSLSFSQQVIISSDRQIREGSHVRLAEE